ncbi:MULTISPECIES: LysR family transcriptional regulator [Prescottella]|uniref:LysR substrate binding domain protein n=1 Tax=Prescottella equi ATCC 33707 TaxID=525370 RepID=E9T469_RHOHA|nr:LysR family transcriptional regulator [Prescottella equi]EGD23036.1 LysR substrate binding domain protein [Prescottella equi ATCC 33707]MBM4520931.1 LysR family transcriptional regulator [Prescottella equi]MBM4532363.1 LysR family transcriptional regulator [Prescottella equi]MBM4543566.1 LysR family transcriptional regulator [Prescottella equi]MBM4574469.1 LysR family transcriptional regulator [Prescottella equi]
MELRQLEYFVAVAEEANFTRAAARVHVSQSGISAQIRQLENDLGAPLFDRSTRVAALTVAGEAALAHARAALAAARAVRDAVDDVNQLVRGRLEVGMVTACTVTPLFDALSSFHRAHPGIDVSLREDNSDRLVDDVRAGAVDLALVGVAGAEPAGLHSFTVVRERLVAAVPGNHPLVQLSSVTLADVCAHPLVTLPPGTGIRTVLDRGCADLNCRASIALQASAPDAVADLATRGLGVAILSESMATSYPDLASRVIADVDVEAVLALVWRPEISPALRELLSFTKRAFA